MAAFPGDPDGYGDPEALGEQKSHLYPKYSASFRRRLDTEDLQKAQRRFLLVVQSVWPGFIHGSHHDLIADIFERIERAELRRAIASLPNKKESA